MSVDFEPCRVDLPSNEWSCGILNTANVEAKPAESWSWNPSKSQFLECVRVPRMPNVDRRKIGLGYLRNHWLLPLGHCDYRQKIPLSTNGWWVPTKFYGCFCKSNILGVAEDGAIRALILRKIVSAWYHARCVRYIPQQKKVAADSRP